MPLYEYRCHKCGHTFELIQKFSDEPLTTHNGCGGGVEKLISSPAFHLKGSGWYATDYAKSAPKSEKGESSG
jgi:putative FmdB family regulatory protein